jgi:hypothetical protein
MDNHQSDVACIVDDESCVLCVFVDVGVLPTETTKEAVRQLTFLSRFVDQSTIFTAYSV